MLPITTQFEFDYSGTEIVYGRGSIGRLDDLLADRDLDSALIVCGRHVGTNDALMDPIKRALGDRLAGVFAETTPTKSAETMYDGIDRMHEVEADIVIGIGGGSSLNIARQMTVFDADGRSIDDLREQAHEGTLTAPDPEPPLLPVAVIPTTFAGADLSGVGSVEILSAEESPTGQPVRTMGSNMPLATLHDPELFETTPKGPLAGSAMNGFNKAIETLYARPGNPITDATAIHSLGLLSDAYPRLFDDDPAAMDRAVVGNILSQFHRSTSIIHAFGHGFARRYPLQQGIAHAVVVPHALRYLFDRVDANRALFARGLGIDADAHTDAELADAVVESVDDIRASLDLPARLRELDPVRREDFPALAAYIVDDGPMNRVPESLDPTAEEIEEILEAAW